MGCGENFGVSRGLALLGLLWIGAGFLPRSSVGAPRTGAASDSIGPRAGKRGCVRVSTELRVAAGHSARRRVASELDIALEARATGWVVRVLPHSGPVPAVDFAEIATPPYRSVSPLLLTTDFSFRAQDAVGWNPREFRSVVDRRMYAQVEPAYRAVTRSARPDPADEGELIRLLAGAAPGRIEILDASLVPGTADRSRAAAAVTSRYQETAHVVVAPGGAASAGSLGRMTGIAVRVSLDLRLGEAARGPWDGVMTIPIACPAGLR